MPILTEFKAAWNEALLKKHDIKKCYVKVFRLEQDDAVGTQQLEKGDEAAEKVIHVDNVPRTTLKLLPNIGSVRKHVPWLPNNTK